MKLAAVFVLVLSCVATTAWTRSEVAPGNCICTLQYDPVCGVDGKVYGNACGARCAKVEVECKGKCPCRKDCDAHLVRCAGNPCDSASCPKHPNAVCKLDDCKACTPVFFLNGHKVHDCHSTGCQCTEQYDPVCGNNGKTYSNDCFAKCENMAVKCKGKCPCPSKPPSCACPAIYKPVCGSNGKTYSNDCSAKCSGVEVKCQEKCPCKKPCACPRIYKPVCGSNKQTYSNECGAKCVGVSVACQGKCPCKTKPTPCICTKEYRPVCGSNKQTYSNACGAKCAGVSVACQGKCPCKTKPEPCICTKEYQPVCGHNGKTYGNKCEAACDKADIKCHKECPCKEEPPKCEPVNCLVDPCTVTTCPRYPGATCKANYCGGCHAEFYWGGRKVDCGSSFCAKKGEACRPSDSPTTYSSFNHSQKKKCCPGWECCAACRPIEIQPYAGLTVAPEPDYTCQQRCLPCRG